jgi:hypothetical protein
VEAPLQKQNAPASALAVAAERISGKGIMVGKIAPEWGVRNNCVEFAEEPLG